MLIPKVLNRSQIYERRSKNQLLLFPPLELPLASCACRPLSTGMLGPPPFTYSVAPPPRRGLAIREPAPPKLKPIGFEDEAMPRVEPSLAASRRSLTAVTCASNLERTSLALLVYKKICWDVPVIRSRQLLLTILQQRLQAQDAFVSGH